MSESVADRLRSVRDGFEHNRYEALAAMDALWPEVCAVVEYLEADDCLEAVELRQRLARRLDEEGIR